LLVIGMGFESYSPASVTIRASEMVEWRSTSLITHTATDDPERAKAPADAGLPAGAQPFDSGDIPAGQIYLRRFPAAGTYHCFCIHHETDGMVGTIAVKPAT
jgi:plastocyanin